MKYISIILLGYLLGCSSMAWYLAKLANADLRSGGSGNLGASNAVVLLGWKAGVLTALHDIGKAVLQEPRQALPVCWVIFSPSG